MSGRIRLDAEPSDTEEHNQPGPAPEPVQPPPQPPQPPQPPPEPPLAAREAAPEPPHTEGDPAPLPPEAQKRIDRLTWEKYEARRQYEELQRQVQQAQQQMRQQQLPPGQADPEERALNRFRAEAAEREFNRACNEVFQRGSAEYQDFPEAVRALNAVGYGGRPDALAAIASMPDGHRVYRALASNLDNAARVLSLPPMQMAMELTRLAHQVPQAPQAPENGTPVSRAPAPLRPIGGGTRAPEKPLKDVSMAEFIRRRDKEEFGSSRIRR